MRLELYEMYKNLIFSKLGEVGFQEHLFFYTLLLIHECQCNSTAVQIIIQLTSFKVQLCIMSFWSHEKRPSFHKSSRRGPVGHSSSCNKLLMEEFQGHSRSQCRSDQTVMQQQNSLVVVTHTSCFSIEWTFLYTRSITSFHRIFCVGQMTPIIGGTKCFFTIPIVAPPK